MVIVKNLLVKIKNQIILKSTSCALLPGKMTLFIGKSGAGKTTLLKSLLGLIPITQGTIFINSKQLDQLDNQQRAEEIGYVFQDFNLFPNLTVLQNCTNPLLIRGLSLKEAEERAYDVLQELKMESFSNNYPIQLSGGQQQRVAISRALCLQPKALLLDEPTASLDPCNTDILIDILKRLTSKGLTVGISSQDVYFMKKIFDRAYYLENGNIIEYCDNKDSMSTCPNTQRFLNVSV